MRGDKNPAGLAMALSGEAYGIFCPFWLLFGQAKSNMRYKEKNLCLSKPRYSR
jgi:membrane associated rhomboid family serine protease